MGGGFQPQNYGMDFVNAMATTAGMVNDRRKLDMEANRQAEDGKTRQLQQQGMELENQSKKYAFENEKNIKKYLEMRGRVDTGTMTPEDYEEFGRVTGDIMAATPYLPSDPKDIPTYKQAVNTVLSGVEVLKQLPASNYIYSRADKMPEIDAGLDAFRVLLSKDRLGKTFTDQDGSITGQPGGKYRTADVGGFFVVSGEGDKAMLSPLFSITREDGTPILDANGRPHLVPSTTGQTNGAKDPQRFLTPEEMKFKAGFAYDVLSNAEKVGIADPERRNQWLTSKLAANMGPEGAKEVLKELQSGPKMTSFNPRDDVYRNDKLIKAGTPEKEKEEIKTVEVGVGGGMMQLFQYSPETKRFTIPIGKPYPKHAPKSDGGSRAEQKRAETDSRAAIDKAIAEIKDARNRLAKEKEYFANSTSQTPDDTDLRNAEQEFADAKTAYKNRTSEHRTSFGREYNPLKEVIDRQPVRSVEPIRAGFMEKAGLFKYRDYPAYIKLIEAKGWTKSDIQKAASGTPAEEAVKQYYSTAEAGRAQQNGMAPSSLPRPTASRKPFDPAAYMK